MTRADPISAFFAVAPQAGSVALFIRFVIVPFGPLIGEWRQVIISVDRIDGARRCRPVARRISSG
jgi:hypothetical protein